MKIALIVIGVVVLLFIIIPLLVVGGSYNKFVTLEEGVDAQWANIVNTVKGFAEHEKEVFTEVTRLRSQWASAGTANEKVGVANEMQGAMGRLMLVAENYPQLFGGAPPL